MFVKEVQQAVLDGRADLAVHSAKDLPASITPDGLVLAAVPERADPRDALVGSTLDALPAGARVGDRVGAPARAARGAAARSHVRRAARQHRHPAREGVASSTPSWSPPPRSTGSGSRDRADRAPRHRRSCSRRSGRARSRSSAAPTTTTPASGSPPSTTPTRTPRSRAERAFLAELGGGCDLPCGALAHRRRRRGRRSRRCSPRSTGSVVLRARATRRRPGAGRASRSPTELLDRGGRSLLDVADGRRDRLPRGRRARRSRTPHRARRRAARARRRRGLRPARVARAARPRAAPAPS